MIANENRQIILIVLSSLIYLTACHSISGPSCPRHSYIVENELQAKFDLSLKNGEPCTPPCWQGLVPGEATEDDAMKVLESVEFVDITSLRYVSDDDSKTIMWRSSISRFSEHVGSFLFDSEGSLILIEIDMEYRLELGELINTIGEPKQFSVLIYDPGASCLSLRLLWPEQGFVAITEDYPAGTRVIPDVLIERVAYYVPGPDATGYVEAGRVTMDYLDRLKDWPGINSEMKIDLSP